MERQELAIWWVGQEEILLTKYLLRGLPDFGLPVYIAAQLDSADGRPKRGRLWVSDGIDFSAIENPNSSFSAEFFDRCAGIVIHARDISHVTGLPGFVTDTKALGIRFATPCT